MASSASFRNSVYLISSLAIAWIIFSLLGIISIFHYCGAVRDLIQFAQFKKREKHPWRSVTFSKVAGWSLVSPMFLSSSLPERGKLLIPPKQNLLKNQFPPTERGEAKHDL